MKIKNRFKNYVLILKEVMPYAKGRLFFGIITSCLGGASSFLKDVMLIKLLIDGLVQRMDFFNLLLNVLFIFLFDVIVNIVSKIFNKYLVKVNSKISKEFTHNIMSKIESIDINTYEDPNFYNEYKKMLSKGEWIFMQYIQSINSLISSLIVIIGIVIYAINLNNMVILVCAVVCILSYLLKNKIIKNNHNMYEKTIEVNRKIDYLERVQYLSDYAQELRTLNLYKYLADKLNSFFNNKVDIQKGFLKKNAILQFVSEIIPYVATYFIISFFTALKIYKKILSVGDFVSINNASFQLIYRCNLVIKRINELYEISLYYDNYKKFMEYESNMKSGTLKADSNIKEGLTINNLYFSYDDTKQVIKNVSMKIKPGEKIAIVGLNGAGKTTLIKLIMRLYDPENGNILLDGKDIREYTLDSYRGLYSTVFQDFKQYAFSVKENLYFEASDCTPDEEACNILDKVGILEKVESHKEGLYAEIGNEFSEGINFSGGESQKLAIARALAKNGSIIILDEASSALDPISERDLNESMLKTFQTKTMIIISHRLSTVINADKIYYFENGEILEQGNHSELIEARGQYYKLFSAQAEQYGINI